ncbi:tape measure domain-containing protein [Hathewaya proteolytica DSM 3090]|uniref:Tape measure domain-containing protein n=1 Tax=Hathewaya proteolytica DSM 3090 TaxID=1121331 RepID=A0A1M6NV07_9CLOT|nr:tape measure protein [Hathewaya proteolytica]SHJ99536.1 tape measure domain-containing protein [Hathewaya proteolytica DSM 3090]
MSRDVSIVFKASDNLSNSVRQMKKNVNDLSHDVTEYRKIQDDAFNKKVELKYDMTKVKKELKDLQSAIKENKEGSAEAFKAKSKEIEQMQEEYRRLTRVVRDTNRAEKELIESRSRNNNNHSGTTDVAGTLVKAGLGKELGTSIGNYAGTVLTSAYGDKIGNRIGTIASSTMAGAMMGSVVPGIGTAIGAGIGAITGALTSASNEIKEADGYFKGEVKDIYSTIQNSANANSQKGIDLASAREQNIISFGTLLGGSSRANSFLKDTEDFASKTPFTQTDLLQISKNLLTYGYKQQELLPTLEKIGDAGSALGLSIQDQANVATGLGRMKSSGKASLEYIELVQERGIDAIGYLAKSMNTDKKKVYEMISKSAIDGAKASAVILNAMGEQFKGNMEKQSETYKGLTSTLEDLKAKGDRAEGKGYTDERKKGLEEEKSYRENLGTYDRELIGKYKAEMDNKAEEAKRKAMDEMKGTTEYIKAWKSDNGAEMGRLLMKAEADAISKYRGSPEMLQRIENERSIVASIQKSIRENGQYVKDGQLAAEDFSKGWASALDLKTAIMSGKNSTSSIAEKGMANMPSSADLRNPNFKWGNGFATGLNRVPYDGLYKLHEGEKVVDKQHASSNTNNEINNFNISINNNSGSAYEITQEICREIIKAKQRAGGVK